MNHQSAEERGQTLHKNRYEVFKAELIKPIYYHEGISCVLEVGYVFYCPKIIQIQGDDPGYTKAFLKKIQTLVESGKLPRFEEFKSFEFRLSNDNPAARQYESEEVRNYREAATKPSVEYHSVAEEPLESAEIELEFAGPATDKDRKEYDRNTSYVILAESRGTTFPRRIHVSVDLSTDDHGDTGE